MGMENGDDVRGINPAELVGVIKQNKMVQKRIKIDDLDPCLAVNNRFREGDSIFGQMAMLDTYDAAGMAEGIRDIGDILVPLDVYPLGNGKYGIFRGRRRFFGASRLRSESPDSPLAKRLETLPCTVYDHVTADSAALLNNDQQSKPYLKFEIYIDFTRLLQKGLDWRQTGLAHMPSLVSAGFGRTNLGSLAKASKEDADKIRKVWLNGTVYQTIYISCMAGKRVYELFGSQLAFEDSLIASKPVCDLTKGKRIQETWNAVKADREAGEHDFTTGDGPRLAILIEKYIVEDGKPKVVAKRGTKKLKSASDIEATQAMHRVNGLSMVADIIGLAFLDTDGAESVTASVSNFEQCCKSFRASRDYLPQDIRDLLTPVFQGGAEAFDKYLSSVAIVPEPETESESLDEIVV